MTAPTTARTSRARIVFRPEGVNEVVDTRDGGAFGARVDDGDVKPPEDSAQQNDADREQREQRDRMRQRVAECLDDAQESRHPCRLRLGRLVDVGIRHVHTPVKNKVRT